MTLLAGLFNWQTLISLLLYGTAILAGAWVFNRLRQRAVFDLQREISTLRKEKSDALETLITDLRREVDHLRATIATIRLALKQRGITVRINGESVTIEDTGAPKRTVMRIPKDQVQGQAAADDDGA